MFRKCLFLSILIIIILSYYTCEGGVSVKEEEKASPSRIAFVSDRDGTHELLAMNANGSNQRWLTDSHARTKVMGDYWSPDDFRIAFVYNRDGNNDIYVMDTVGSNQTNLNNDPGEDFYPVWSPYYYKHSFVL